MTLHEVDSHSVQLIVEYAYTGRLEINKHNAQNLLAAASLFQIQPILKACAKFMESQLDVSNCIGIFYFASLHNCKQLKNKAKEYIDKSFREVALGEEFFCLSHDKVAEILSSNDLNVEKEEEVFTSLIAWVQFAEKERRDYLSDLLPVVRFGLLNSRYINDDIANHVLVSTCPKCLQLLKEVKLFEENPETYKGEHNFSIILRSGMIKPENCILFIGGVDQRKPSINCYNPLTRECYYMNDVGGDDGKQGYFDVEDPACVVTENNEIFVAGGNYLFHERVAESPSEDSYEEFDEDAVRKNFYQYDNDHDCWMPKAPMLFPKSNFSLAYVDGKVFCFGGLTLNQHPTEIVECYDIKTNRWNYVGMMPTTLVDLCTVVYHGLIYVLGGRTGVGAHNVVICFDPKKNEWTSLAGMPTPRFNFGCCVVNDEIYVVGGQIYSHSINTINREALNSVEIYNIQKNQWRQGPELKEDIYNVGLCNIQGSLYACGTTEYHRSVYRIYRYNVVYKLEIGKTQWKQIESDLCDIRDFSCIAAKMHTRKLSQVFRPEVDT